MALRRGLGRRPGPQARRRQGQPQARGVPVRIDSTTLSTSSRVIRPPPPVPTIWAAESSCSRRRRRTAGVMRASGSAPAMGAVATGAVAMAAAAGTLAVAAAISLGPRSSLPAGPADGGGVVGAVAAASAFGAAAAVAGAAGVAAAAVPAPSSDVSMTAISALFGTVAPSSARISRRMPSKGDGTSALTLSVITSTSGSYLSTWSPGCLSHFPIVPSATLSPSWGIVTLATFAGPPLAAGSWVGALGRIGRSLVSPISTLRARWATGNGFRKTAIRRSLHPSGTIGAIRCGSGAGRAVGQAVVGADQAVGSHRWNSSRQTGRSPRRRAHVDRVPSRSARVARCIETSSKPTERHAAATRGSAVSSKARSPWSPSVGTTDARTSTRPPGATIDVIPRRAEASRPRAPRSSDPQGSVTQTSEAAPTSGPGSASTASTRKMALARRC